MKEYALKCTRADFNHAPKRNWDIVFEIIKGFQGHYRKSAPKQYKDANGRTKITEADNTDVIQKYYHNIFNQEISIDKNEIEKLPQRDTNEHLGRILSQNKVTTAIKNMASEKAPGRSGVVADMLKNSLPKDTTFSHA